MAGHALLAGLCAGGLAAGVLGIVAGIRGTVPTDRPVRRRRTRRTLSAVERRKRQVRWTAAAGVGVAAWFASGWLLAVPLVMLAVVGWPWLMAPTKSDSTGIDRLEALAAWTRRVADHIEVGVGLETAIIESRDHCPPPIKAEVNELTFRLQARWPTVDALHAFADAFNDVTADKTIAALMLRANDRGPGLTSTLRDYAETVREEVSQRRGIEADRAPARTAVRWVVYLTLALAGGMALNRDYGEPYASPLGQLALAVLAGSFIAVLLWMRALAAFKTAPRFLVPDARSVVDGAKRTRASVAADGGEDA